MDLTELLNRTKEHVPSFLLERLPLELVFHNINHSFEVVAAAREIGMHSGLTSEQLAIVELAAWFHDCGYAYVYKGHERYSESLATEFLGKLGCPSDVIASVVADISATEYPQRPSTITSQVLCDADLYHFTRPDYHSYEASLRSEMKYFFNKEYTDEAWAVANCTMMQEHSYHTRYGKEVLQLFKDVNIKRMQCKY